MSLLSEDLIGKKSVVEIIKNLELLETELRLLTHNIERLVNPKQKMKKEDLFFNLKNLRLETETLLKEVEENRGSKDVEFIRRVTNRVKEILNEKRMLEEELRLAGNQK